MMLQDSCLLDHIYVCLLVPELLTMKDDDTNEDMKAGASNFKDSCPDSIRRAINYLQHEGMRMLVSVWLSARVCVLLDC